MHAAEFLSDQEIKRARTTRSPWIAFADANIVPYSDQPDFYGNISGHSVGSVVVLVHDDQQALPSWFTSLSEETPGGTPSTEQLALYIAGIHRMIIDKQFFELTIVLQRLPISQVSTASLVAVLRSTFPVREKLSNWKSATRLAEQELLHRGMDPSTVLKGLL